MNHYELEARNAIFSIGVEALLAGTDIDMCSIIAATRGWLPLQIDEKMTVHYHGKEYVITREE